MWKLEGYRIITSVGGWANLGEYATADLALDAIIYSGYALEYRITSPTGEYHEITWQDSCDEEGYEYTTPTLGEVCNNWPQVIGNVR